MNTATNKPRIRFESGIVAYIPLPFGKAINVLLYKHMYLKHIITIRTRDEALYDYADHGLKAHDLLVALTRKVA
jgi:hypothetical protein